jgi:sugar/nucleoside kinase (ribokinase family)
MASRLIIDFLVIGHIAHDRTPDGFRLGGTVSYAAVTARRLGRRPGILTRGTAEGLGINTAQAEPGNAVVPAAGPLAGVAVHLLPAAASTTFVNIYHDGQRRQMIETVAAPLTPEELPPAWAGVPIVLLGPIAREVPPAWLAAFPNALIGVTPQGWMRRWDAAGHVYPAPWESAAEFLQRTDVLILSREDVGDDDAALAALARMTRLMVATDGWRGATLYHDGASYYVPPRPANEVDPTGAGDVFATAFLIRLAETGDPLAAARFANVVASFSVEAPGVAGIPCRKQVDEWLRANE